MLLGDWELVTPPLKTDFTGFVPPKKQILGGTIKKLFGASRRLVPQSVLQVFANGYL